MAEPVTVVHPPQFAGSRKIYRDGHLLGTLERDVTLAAVVFRATRSGRYDASELRAIAAELERLEGAG